MIETSAFDAPFFGAHSLSIGQLKDFNKPVFALLLNGKFSGKNQKGEFIIRYNDDEHVISYLERVLDEENILSFDRKYYLQNKEAIDEQLFRILSTTKSDHIILADDFIREDFIRAISKNSNIKAIYLSSNDGKYTLTKEIYDIIVDSSIETIYSADAAPEIRDIFNGKIYCNDSRCLIYNYTYSSLSKCDRFLIDTPLSDEEIINLKYLKKGCEVEFVGVTDYDNVLKVINYLEENRDIKINIKLRPIKGRSYKNDFNAFIDKHPELIDKNITVIMPNNDEKHDSKYLIKDYYNYEKRLYDLIKDAYDLSPFEKDLFAYSVVTRYKQYKENPEDTWAARDLYRILDGEYMVCVGYAEMLRDLLDKLGIESDLITLGVVNEFSKVSLDAEVTPEGMEVGREEHMRLMVHLVDPKYGIDGIFYADPTWDNVMEINTYNYSLMTQEEFLRIYRSSFYSREKIGEVFFSKTIDEFYTKANFWMTSNIKKIDKEYSAATKKEYTHAISELFLEYIEKLKEFDENEYNNVILLFGNLKNAKFVPSNMKYFEKREMEYLKSHYNPELENTLYRIRLVVDSFNDGKNKYLKDKVNIQKDFIKSFIEYLKYLDYKKYDYFYNKYKDVYEYNFIPDDYFISSAMFDFGEYVVNNMNHEVSGEKYKAALMELYSKCYGVPDDKLEEEVNKVMYINKARQEPRFPVRYKITEDDKVPISDHLNKFDIDNMNISM